MNRVKNGIALVTGAGADLGAQIARRSREEGAALIINDIHTEAAERLAGEVKGPA